MSTLARQAREALGVRLRDIRADAGLTGRALAAAAGWHYTKVSKLEHGVINASEADVTTWCRLCNAPDQLPDLVAAVRSIDTLIVEWRRQLRSGTKRRQKESVRFEAETTLFRVFEPMFVPGLLQTAEYAAAVLSSFVEFHGLPPDVDAGVEARLERQQILYRGDRRFHMVICESALTLGVAPTEVLVGQLDRLLAASTLPRVHLGIIPTRATHLFLPINNFWILDNSAVLVETISAEIKLTQPREIAVYAKAFERFASSAVYGRDARSLITTALREFHATS
ncbi:helix-turn-helix transcriptional regulator [Plantactinospora sp. KLBMP9567]|uniref:helix-turn-helix transcriptional regulator n=1 Tax=Plantactinospora sp. KLBMP9567 TaxID=3085900 RepID=UPI0029825905|nr:helix-turn-helix transcriptional regulator [Plantactinospora sp. KLBMP9567]MDW5328945.1 helix-turn-helix transcriptional regulator [Plantactinospora sp. KLBMP9567]